MFLRAFALLAALAVPLLMTIEAISGLHPWMLFIGPLAAVFATLPILLAAKTARTQALFGAALAAMAAASTAELPELLRVTGEDAQAVHDLTQAPLSNDAEGYVTVRGYLRDEWVVDEYGIPEQGQRPNQNEAPRAVLLPLLGDNDEVIEINGNEGRVIVARVSPTRLQKTPVTLRGKLGPVEPEIVDSLFVVQYQDPNAAASPSAPPPAVLLDTFEVPTRGQALTRVALALGAALLALVLLLVAVADAHAATADDPKPS